MASLFKRGNTWWIVYWDRINAKQIRVSTRTKDEARAKRKLKAIQAHLQLYGTDSDLSAQPKSIILASEAFNTYIASKRYNPHTEQLRRTGLEYLIDACTNKPITSYTTMDNLRFQEHLRNLPGRFSGKMAPNTVAFHTKNIKAFFSWLQKQKLISENPFTKTREQLNPVRVITKEEFSAILAETEHPAFAKLFRFLYFTGLRISEALALVWDDIDFKKGLIRVQNKKAGREDLMPLLKQAEAILKQIPDSKQRIFPYTPQYALRVWSASCERAGLKFKLHDLRRTCATNLSEYVSPFTLQRYMRHTNINITLKYYIREDLNRMKEELSRAALYDPQTQTTKDTQD